MDFVQSHPESCSECIQFASEVSEFAPELISGGNVGYGLLHVILLDKLGSLDEQSNINEDMA